MLDKVRVTLTNCGFLFKGKTLDAATVQKVLNFFRQDTVSAPMPGMNDTVVVKNDLGEKEHVQKRLLLGPLRELYAIFKLDNPVANVGLSKFATLRPKECVFINASGAHTVCVCIIHQNVKLSMLGEFLSM